MAFFLFLQCTICDNTFAIWLQLLMCVPGAYPLMGFIPPKLLKCNLTTDAEYVANLVSVMRKSLCGCQRATVQFITWYDISA